MTNNKCLYLAAFTLFFLLLSCNNNKQKNAPTIVAAKQLYTCSMHPQIIEEKPDDCPICGMKLIKKNQQSDTNTSSIIVDSLLNPINEIAINKIPVTTLLQKNTSDTVKSYGTIEYDANASGTISARVSGRIEKLYIHYRYQAIQKGQKIMDIYSPELLTAQQNLLFLLSNDTKNIAFINTAKEKLLLLGMSVQQLKEIIATHSPTYTVSIYSNYTGHIDEASMHETNNNTMPSTSLTTVSLNLKEGMAVQKGQTLFMVMSHHLAWVALQIYPQDEPFIKKGNAVTITPETDTTNRFSAQIDFIEPFFRTNNKTLTARVYFNNTFHFPIGSHVSAIVYTENKKADWIPQSSVVNLGLNQVVFIKNKSSFKAHKIVTGLRNNNEIQVRSGLNINDTIAINAAYLIDSESFIKPYSN